MCVYVNHGCTCGPYLDGSRVAQLPERFGPGNLNRVLRECVQACVDAALRPVKVLGLLPTGDGKVHITGETSGWKCGCHRGARLCQGLK